MREYPETLITAFLTSYHPADIMRATGISKCKYYRLKADPDFQRIVTERRTEIVRTAVLKMEGYISENVDSLQEIIRNKEVKEQVRINAMKLMSDQYYAGKHLTELQERLLAVEEKLRKEDSQKKNKTV